jgi:hypothetical protein
MPQFDNKWTPIYINSTQKSGTFPVLSCKGRGEDPIAFGTPEVGFGALGL